MKNEVKTQSKNMAFTDNLHCIINKLKCFFIPNYHKMNKIIIVSIHPCIRETSKAFSYERPLYCGKVIPVINTS